MARVRDGDRGLVFDRAKRPRVGKAGIERLAFRVDEPEFVLKKRLRGEDGSRSRDNLRSDCSRAYRLDDDDQICSIGKCKHLVGRGVVRNSYDLVAQVEFEMVLDKDVGDAGARDDRTIL